jgi:hypothetical protein
MSLREEILKEHSKAHALEVARYACRSKKDFKELIACFLDDDQRLAQRAAWSVGWAARINRQMVIPHIADLIGVLRNKNVHDAVTRNAARVLQEIEIPEIYQGEVMDACFQLLENPSTPVAIKACSLTVIANLSNNYPEIKPELKLIIEDLWEHETAAFRATAKKILSQMEK